MSELAFYFQAMKLVLDWFALFGQPDRAAELPSKAHKRAFGQGQPGRSIPTEPENRIFSQHRNSFSKESGFGLTRYSRLRHFIVLVFLGL